LRQGEFQYIVWDAYTASHSRYFAGKALRLVRRFHGVVVFTSASTVRLGPHTVSPAITVYEVHP
jgi:uroporphyrinogen-III synthase